MKAGAERSRNFYKRRQSGLPMSMMLQFTGDEADAVLTLQAKGKRVKNRENPPNKPMIVVKT